METRPVKPSGHSTEISRTVICNRRINRVDGAREEGDVVFGSDTLSHVYKSPRIGLYVESGMLCKMLTKLVSCKVITALQSMTVPVW